MTRIPRYVYLGIGVIMGSVIKSARKLDKFTHKDMLYLRDTADKSSITVSGTVCRMWVCLENYVLVQI